MKFVRGSQLRKYSEKEIEQAMRILKSKGDLFYRDLLRSVIFPDPDMTNPPP